MSAALPESWTRRIFSEMRNNYGARWDRMWAAPETGETDPAKRKQEIDAYAQEMIRSWSYGLAEFVAQPQCLQYALDHLPPKWPPDMPQFRELARSVWPREEHQILTLAERGTPPTPEAKARLNELLRGLRAKVVAPRVRVTVDRVVPDEVIEAELRAVAERMKGGAP